MADLDIDKNTIVYIECTYGDYLRLKGLAETRNKRINAVHNTKSENQKCDCETCKKLIGRPRSNPLQITTVYRESDDGQLIKI